MFAKGRIAEKEGQFAAADEVYRSIIEKWPDDREFTPKAMRAALVIPGITRSG